MSFGVELGWGGGNNGHVNLNTHGLHGAHRNKICISVMWGGVGVEWSGGNNVHVNLNTHGGAHRNKICISVMWGGVGVGWG